MKWKKTWMELKFFPHNAQFESYMQTWEKDGSKKYPPLKWDCFFNSLHTALDGKSIGAFIHNVINEQKPFYASWENVVVEKDAYTSKKDGKLKDSKSMKILALYATYEDMIAAYDEHFPDKVFEDSVDSIPGFGTGEEKTEPVQMDVALQFVATLARQIADDSKGVLLDDLQAKFGEIPMLSKLDAQSDEVAAELEKAGLNVIPF